MATKKDLTEAYAFSRRRLVTAFVSGAPGGREMEPSRPGRTIVGGAALSVLLIAGAVIAGVFSPRVDEGWADGPGLIVSKESGAAYVITDVEEGEEPVLRPVINITSARLILGPGIEPEIVPDAYINQEQRGDDIGILGAPANVPDPEVLIGSGWTACSDVDGGHGFRLAVSSEPAVTTAPPEGALLVEVEGDRDPAVFVVATSGGPEPRAHSYRVPASRDRDNLLEAIGLPAAGSANVVPEEWLALFPRGGDLTLAAFDLDGEGDPAAYATGLPGLQRARVGDVVDTPAGPLLLAQDELVDLDPFAAAVYDRVGAGSTIALDEPPALTRAAEPPYADAHWPIGPLTRVLGQQCAQLSAVPGERPGVAIVTSPGGEASAEEVGPGDRSVWVDAGAGAYVLTGGWDQVSGGAPHLVDAKGQRYPFVGAETATQLGYADHPAPTVPDAWVELFDPGVPLSQNAALCPPDSKPGRSCA